MRRLLMIFSLVWTTLANAAEPAMPPGPNQYESSEYKYRITFPSGWTLTEPNQAFTQVKARAPTGGYAAMSVACRDSLWQGDVASKQYADAWKALDGVSISTFTNRFEQNTSKQAAAILSVEKTTLGKRKTLKVDYLLTDEARGASVRIRSFFILRGSRWYSISCATLASRPDVFLDSMLRAAATFEFYDEKHDG